MYESGLKNTEFNFNMGWLFYSENFVRVSNVTTVWRFLNLIVECTKWFSLIIKLKGT